VEKKKKEIASKRVIVIIRVVEHYKEKDNT
jgi:hypothetical protein